MDVFDFGIGVVVVNLDVVADANLRIFVLNDVLICLLTSWQFREFLRFGCASLQS